MVKVKFRRFPAASILETLVAMVLILVVFGIAATIFVQATTSSFSFRKMEAVSVLERYMLNTEQHKSFYDGEEEIEGFRVTRKVGVPDPGTLVRVRFSVFEGSGKKIYEINRLLILK